MRTLFSFLNPLGCHARASVVQGYFRVVVSEQEDLSTKALRFAPPAHRMVVALRV